MREAWRNTAEPRASGDLGLIESALASAQNTFYYANGDVFEVAAALVFLALNGVYAQPPQWALYLAMIDVAEKKKSKADLAVIFRTSAGSV